MLSNPERRFTTQWRQQKAGLRWKYYLQFTIAWTVVAFLVLFFLTKLFTDLWETGTRNLIFILIGTSVAIGLTATHFSYTTNEKKYNEILKKEDERLN